MKQSFEQSLANLEASNPPIYNHIRTFVGSRTGKIMAHCLKSVYNMPKSVMYQPGYFEELKKCLNPNGMVYIDIINTENEYFVDFFYGETFQKQLKE